MIEQVITIISLVGMTFWVIAYYQRTQQVKYWKNKYQQKLLDNIERHIDEKTHHST